MVESNSKDPQAEQQDCAAAPGLSRDHGGAEDLNALLHSIADHFAGSGRRPPMLGEVQHLELKAPQQGTATIGRIEAGVAVLAEHIGEASRALPSVAASDTILPFSRPSHAPSPVTEKRSRAPLASPPPYQDLGAWAAAPGLSPVGAAEIIVADPLDLAEPSMSEGEDHAWDPTSADALASTYDVGKGRGVAAEPGAPAAKACEGCHGAPAEAVSAEEERAWLDARLAEVATRIEQSLNSALSESSVLTLGERFQQFEQRFGSALADVATRADVAGLPNIEAHMIELAHHVHDAHQRLARLGPVERQLSQLSERMSEERIARIAGPSTISQSSINGIAGAVAERLREQFDNLALDATTHRETLQELRHLVQELIAEQREGDAETASVLETVQQAMIGVLDRIEVLEAASKPSAAVAADAAPSASPPEQTNARGPENSADLEAQEAIDRSWVRAMAEDAREEAEPARVQAQPSPRQAAATLAWDAVPAEPEPQPETLRPANDSTAFGDGASAAAPVKQSREEFIAAARRAARQAANQPEEDKPLPGTSSAAAPGAASRATIMTRSRLIVAAVLGLLVAGIGITSCTMSRGGPDKALKANPKLAAPEADAARLGAVGKGAVLPDAPSAGPSTNTDGANDGLGGESEAEPAPAPRDGASHGLNGLVVPVVREAAAGGSLDDARVAAGITVDTDAILSAHEILRSQQRQAANSTVQAVPAALVTEPRDAAEAGTASTAAIAQSPANPSAQDLPPALIGPLSLRLAAAKGDPSAEFEVAARFAEAKGVPQDLKQAVTWYQRAAARGFAPAQYRLATLYERGLGIKADLAFAKIWYKRAAEQGNVKAMHNLAVLTAGANTTAPDYPAAARWFTEAAERGLADSQFNLAILYEGGFGVTKDLKQAYKWASLVAQSGDKQAARHRDQLKAKLQPDEVRQAEELVASWRPKAVDALINDARVAGEAWKSRQVGGPSG